MKPHIRYLAILLFFCAMTLMIPVSAIETDSNEVTTISQDSPYPNFTGLLPNVGDSHEYIFQIDHSLYPDAVLFAFTYGGTGDVVATIYDEEDASVASVGLKAQGISSSPNMWPKEYSHFRTSNACDGIKTYTLRVRTTTGNAGYAVNIGTLDTFAECFGGSDNVTTIAKSVATPYNIGWAAGKATLLNGDGEWYHYTADGYTYITAAKDSCTSLAFVVYDAETGLKVYSTSADDRVIKTYSPSSFTGAVQKGLALEAGHDYLIQFYSTSPITTSNLSEHYNIYIGLPWITTGTASIASTSSYNLAANKEATYRFTINQVSNSARMDKGAKASFATSSTANNRYITSCKITAPNGQTYTAPYGVFTFNDYTDLTNLLGNVNNVPINGTWTVKVKASRSLSGLKFKINGNYKEIIGHSGN